MMNKLRKLLREPWDTLLHKVRGTCCVCGSKTDAGVVCLDCAETL